MMELMCETCNKAFYVDEVPRRGFTCFKCHIKGVRLGFTYGQEDFHGPTIRERQRQTVEQAAINGYTAEPVTNWM